MLSGRGLCDKLITRPEESYRLWCIVVCDLETSRICAPYIYIYDISSLKVNRSPTQCLWEVLLLGVQQLGREADHSPLSFPKERNMWIYVHLRGMAKEQNLPFFIPKFSCIVNVVFFLLGDSPRAKFSVPTFQNTLYVPSS